MGPEGNILVNSSISIFQQGLTHSALTDCATGKQTTPRLGLEQVISHQHINIARGKVFDNLAILRSFPLQTTQS